MKKIIIFILLVLIVLVVYLLGKDKNLNTGGNEANTFATQEEKPILERFSSDNPEDIQRIYVDGVKKKSAPPPPGMR